MNRSGLSLLVGMFLVGCASAPKEEPIRAGKSKHSDVKLDPVDSRYDIPLPEHDRYGRRRAIDAFLLYAGSGEYPWLKSGGILDPYNTNRIKGDKPILGEHLFLRLDEILNSVVESREIAGGGNEIDIKTTVFSSVDLFYGDTVFRPPSWRIKITGAFDIRHADLVTADRTETDFALQEGFVEVLLAEFDPYFDFLSGRAGRQAFTSDFFGFVFTDINDGVRFFGTAQSKRIQYDLAVFNLVAKDPLSNLNRTDTSRQQLFAAANLFLQDSPSPGYTFQFTVQYVRDQIAQEVDILYFGFLGEGVIGPFKVAHAVYQSLGNDDANAIAGQSVDVSAQLFAIEIALPRDWITPRISFLFASGDSSPTDGDGRGFDGVFDNPQFADAGFGFWHRQGTVLGGQRLSNGFSLLPNLRGKAVAAPNSVNPGLLLFHAGVDIMVSNGVVVFLNASYLRFAHTAVLETVFAVPALSGDLGVDLSIGIVYRPLGIDNIVLTGGVAGLIPMGGFRQLFGSETLLASFFAVTLVF